MSDAVPTDLQIRRVPAIEAAAAARALAGLVRGVDDPDAAGFAGHVADRGGIPVLAGIRDPRGGPTEPDDPALVFAAAADGPLDVEALAALAADAVAAATDAGLARLVSGCDPMDLPTLRALESAGFRTVGRQPWFALGGGQVEFVTGYADATGATLDVAADCRPSPS